MKKVKKKVHQIKQSSKKEQAASYQIRSLRGLKCNLEKAKWRN